MNWPVSELALADAILAALMAADNVTLGYANDATPAEIDAAEQAHWEARREMLAAFHRAGVPEYLVRKIGDAL